MENSCNYPDDFHQNIPVTEISRTLKISNGRFLHLGLEFPDNCSVSPVLFRPNPGLCTGNWNRLQMLMFRDLNVYGDRHTQMSPGMDQIQV